VRPSVSLAATTATGSAARRAAAATTPRGPPPRGPRSRRWRRPRAPRPASRPRSRSPTRNGRTGSAGPCPHLGGPELHLPLEQHALEGEREPVPVDSRPLDVRGALGFGELPREDRVLVVQGLVPARTQDRLAQPLQAEDEQERADDDPQPAERDHRQGGSER